MYKYDSSYYIIAWKDDSIDNIDIITALVWLIVCGIHYRDILQIQIWIGGMLALNMVEMSVFCNKYQVCGFIIGIILVVGYEVILTLIMTMKVEQIETVQW